MEIVPTHVADLSTDDGSASYTLTIELLLHVGIDVKRNAFLVYNPGTPEEQEYSFIHQIVIGRRPEAEPDGQWVSVRDPTVSGRHCIVRQSSIGRFFVQDVSRNGTRLSGQRLIPNVEVEIRPGDRIRIGEHVFVLAIVESADSTVDLPIEDDDQTRAGSTHVDVTILVGDIRNYTTLNQEFDPIEFFPCLSRIFAELENVIRQHDGAIKEYQGDAIFAFWEADTERPGWHAKQACKAALALDQKLQRLARDPAVWDIPRFPLRMDWALTTGSVLVSRLGGDRPTGLALVGNAVNYAFRLEKLANDANGAVLACADTYALAKSEFLFRTAREVKLAGYADVQRVYALERWHGEQRSRLESHEII